ncbi:MAG TPA: hypothetical protein VGB06_05810 [Solirubrobacterales bacterium]
MLHHVSLEVRPEHLDGCADCWRLLGFEPVEAPAELGGHVTWLERAGTQIHLIPTDAASVPELGHPAVVVADFEGTFAAVERAGHAPERHRELWGEPRAFVTMPGGQKVEFMAAPPG